MYEELARQLAATGVVKRELARTLPADCPAGPAGLLALLGRHGEMRLSALSTLLGVDISVTSRHVAYVAERGWIERAADPGDGRCRILRLTPAGNELLTILGAGYSAALERALADWSAEDVRALNTLLARLRSSF